MTYLRVKPEHDNAKRYTVNNPRRVEGMRLGNELLTPREAEHYLNFEAYTEPVEVSRKKVYWFFGGRFSDEYEPLVLYYNGKCYIG